MLWAGSCCHAADALDLLEGVAHVSRHARSNRLYAPPCCRTEPLATVTLPVLELQAEDIMLSYLYDDDPSFCYASAPSCSADLPVGFRALWLRTGRISLASAEHRGGGEMTDVDEVEELCRFMGLAPACYEEFRFVTYYGISIDVTWLSESHDDIECATGGFATVQAGAKAMQRFADDHGLVVSVRMSDDQPYLLVTRSRS